MQVKSITVPVLVLCAIMVYSSMVSIATGQQADYDRIEADIERLEDKQEETIQEWIKSGQEHLESFKSPSISGDNASYKLPPECIEHLKKEQEKLEKEEYSKEAWFRHVFECEKCCAPLLTHLMDIHRGKVIQQPHMVMLFDLDTYSIKDEYKEHLDRFMQTFDATQDKILLIGRASNIGKRGYNITLSGERTGEIKDYFVEQFGVDESKIRVLYFGYDPPQLTLEYAKAYGVTDEDLTAIDTAFTSSAGHKINQSVVAVIYQASDDDMASDPTIPRVALQDRPEGSRPVEAPPGPAIVPEAGVPQAPAGRIAIVTGSPSGLSARFGQDIAQVARNAGLNILVQRSEGVIDTLRRLMLTEGTAVGFMPSDVLSFLSADAAAALPHGAEQLRVLLPLYHEEVHLLARKEIQRFEDLDGKRVIIGTPESGTWLTAQNLLRLLRVQPAELIDHLLPPEAVASVLTGEADAMFYVAGKPVDVFIRLHDLQQDQHYAHLVPEVHFVPLPHEQMPQEYVAATLGAEDYDWVKSSVPTIAVKAALISLDNSNLSPHYGRQGCTQRATLAQLIRDTLPTLQRTGHPKWQEVDLQQRLVHWQDDTCVQSQAMQHKITPGE